MKEVQLNTLCEGDFLGIWRYSSSRLATQYLTWPPYSEMEYFCAFFKNKMLAEHQDNYFLSIKYENEVIGSVHILCYPSNIYQFGYGFHEKFWGRGIGKKVLQLIISNIRQKSNYQEVTIYGDVNINNNHMRKILMDEGFLSVDGFVDSERQRVRYIKKFSEKTYSLYDYLESLEIVECVLKIKERGNGNNYSDLDSFCVLYEECHMESIMDLFSSVYPKGALERVSPNHIHVFDEFNYDIYILSSAMYWAMQNELEVIFDKRGFISRNFGENLDLSYIMKRLAVKIERLFGKLIKEEYVAAERVASDIRDHLILPILSIQGFVELKNLVEFKWNKNSDPIYHQFCHLYPSITVESFKLYVTALEYILKQAIGDDETVTALFASKQKVL